MTSATHHERLAEYAGPATLLAEGDEIPVEVTLRGMFQPLDGRFHWYGRMVASAGADALDSGTRVELRTEHGVAAGRINDRDPWGRFRIAGTGRPPF